MLSVFFLSVLPLMSLGLFSVALIAELFWRIFARSRNPEESSNVSDAAAALRFTSFALTLYGLVALPLALPLASSLQATQASVSLLTLAVIALLGSRRYRHPDIVVFVLFTAVSSVYLLNSSDVLTMFFVLEVLNSLVLYSFFFTASYTGASHSNAAARIATSCVYQFTLNFFSSILLYIGLVGYIGVTGGASLAAARLWGADDTSTLSLSLFVAAFLLKFGTGPWIFFKVNVYRNMNFQLVLLYSAAYMLVIFILFLNLVFVFGVTLPAFTVALVSTLIVASTALFGSFAFQNPNTFVFISFSSLINMGVFVLQAITVA